MASVIALFLLFFPSSRAHPQHRRWEPSTLYTDSRPPFSIPQFNKTYVCFPTATATRASLQVIPIPDEPTSTSRASLQVIPIPDTIWTTVPIANLTADPFCVNAAAPHEGIGNHCVCQNGETLSIIPYTSGGNSSDYQPCAYTTVDQESESTTSTVAMPSQTLVTCTMSMP
ncbi:hypothetical protein B0T21DRAFT_386948 [Apiosordaria backusii]|uniref:Uncharacterized protein n=1 Tax=Apiosordaria backusii TaxID=314023 RepID=A0AA40AEA5_9PEZI|nr:hypothetical protein B0T21DRAFT_386948 [Apiosordaria backusii]